jgi:hypothetical protein
LLYNPPRLCNRPLISLLNHFFRLIYHLIFVLRPGSECPCKKSEEIENNDNKQTKPHQFEHLFWLGIEKDYHNTADGDSDDRIGV